MDGGSIPPSSTKGGLAEFGCFSSRNRPFYCWFHVNAVPIGRSVFRWRSHRTFCNIVTIAGRGDGQTYGARHVFGPFWSAARGVIVRKLDVLLGIGTVVMLVNVPSAILVGDFSRLLGGIVGGVAGIVHFRRLAAKVDLLCRAPVGGPPDARPKRKLHRFKTVEGSGRQDIRRTTRVIECSLCGAQREIVRYKNEGGA